MTPSGDRQDKSKVPPEKGVPPDVGRRAARLGGEVGFSTLFIILGAVFGGLWLDNYLGTKPLIMLTLVLGTVPVSLFITYRMARRAVKDFEESRKPAKRNNQSIEGDDTGE